MDEVGRVRIKFWALQETFLKRRNESPETKHVTIGYPKTSQPLKKIYGRVKMPAKKTRKLILDESDESDRLDSPLKVKPESVDLLPSPKKTVPASEGFAVVKSSDYNDGIPFIKLN
ncbi:hypothetical protein RJT34_07484 [Clitoria ternatea]|uniref:Uncharacterized protein n=1 Tax=Clitoria ternatea TaxID=43366 RepID=A0AAN9PTJ3_CLITE